MKSTLALVLSAAIFLGGCSSPVAPQRSMQPKAGAPSRDYICVADPGGQPTYGECPLQYGSGYIVWAG